MTFNVSTLGGELRKLGERFGMDRKNVNTIAEEENFTNFLIIVDSVATLFVIWQQARPFFVRDGVDDPKTENDSPFLGTQLVLISQATRRGRRKPCMSATSRWTRCSWVRPNGRRCCCPLDEGGIVIQGAPAVGPATFPIPIGRP